ncbi:NAD(P)H-dependent oxidoreductase [Micromonospora sp. NPDC023814]|uniref:NADPH-dependent FMN reductase n=1 Tax=Micromonospora sp. NPDC023814 TaxID=3154596 RepID=UPI0033F14643
MSGRVRLLGISGSLRARSYNTALLHAARAVAPEGVALEIADIGEVPLFNDDLLPDPPGAVARLRAQVVAADGLLLAAPEYNGGVTGVLKNALDWLSVPPTASALRRKHVALVGASPGMLGTARAQTQLRAVLTLCGARVVAAPEVLVAHAHRRFDDDLALADEQARLLLGKLVGRLVREIRGSHPLVPS